MWATVLSTASIPCVRTSDENGLVALQYCILPFEPFNRSFLQTLLAEHVLVITENDNNDNSVRPDRETDVRAVFSARRLSHGGPAHPVFPHSGSHGRRVEDSLISAGVSLPHGEFVKSKRKWLGVGG